MFLQLFAGAPQGWPPCHSFSTRAPPRPLLSFSRPPLLSPRPIVHRPLPPLNPHVHYLAHSHSLAHAHCAPHLKFSCSLK